MADPIDRNTTNRSTFVRETQRTSGSSMAFIVGGLVVLVGIIAFFVFGDRSVAPAGSTGGNITIENSTPAPAPMAEQPAAEPPAAAPADPVPAEPAPSGNGATPPAP